MAGALTLATSPTVPAAMPLPKGVVAGPSVEAIAAYALAVGLRVLLLPDATKTTVTVNVTCGVGPAQENSGETGMAHLLASSQRRQRGQGQDRTDRAARSIRASPDLRGQSAGERAARDGLRRGASLSNRFLPQNCANDL